jgi:hypothetical protein
MQQATTMSRAFERAGITTTTDHRRAQRRGKPHSTVARTQAVREIRTLEQQKPRLTPAATPIQGGETVGIRITVEQFDPRTRKLVKSAVTNIPSIFAPATKSALEEISTEVASRLEGQYPFAREQAYTDAVVGLRALAAVFHQIVPQGDSRYVAGSR